MIIALVLWLPISALISLAAGRFIRVGMVELQPQHQETEP